MISRKIICSLLCIGTLSQAMDTPEKSSLYPVVGSTRKTTLQNSFPYKQLWSEQAADLSHTLTYEGRATTIDIQECFLPDAQSIKADVCSDDLSEYIFEDSYIERFPTFIYQKSKDGTIQLVSTANSLGMCIQKVGGRMNGNRIMEVEWHPFLILPKKSIDTVKSVLDKEYTKDNPFTAAINVGLMAASVQMACGKPIPDDIDCPKKFVSCTKKLSKTLVDLIVFYAQMGVGTVDQLRKRILEELWLWDKLDETGMLAALPHGPTASLEQFSQAIQKFCLADKSITYFERIALELNGQRLYDTNDILTDSLFCFMLCDAAIIHGQKYVKKFMLNNGFKNVTIERKTSKRNGRTNVWIVEGTKA